MLWDQEWIKPRLGYTTTETTNIFQKILNTAGVKTYRFDQVNGNTGFAGRWMWKLASNVVNYAAKCNAWYQLQPSAAYINAIKSHSESQCPRGLWQAIRDRRFRFSQIASGTVCYKSRATWFFSFTSLSYHVQCCYDPSTQALIRSVDSESTELLTSTFISQQYDWTLIRSSSAMRRRSRSEAVVADTEAFGFCCQKSALCNLYEEKSPLPIHGFYRSPFFGK